MLIPLIVVFVVVFFLFVFLFRRIINKNITSAVRHLDQISQDYVQKQEEADRKLEEAQRLYKETVNKAKEEALILRQDLLKQAQQEKDNIVQNAQTQAQDIVQQAEKSRYLLISELEKRIDLESVKKASILLGEVLPKDIGEEIHSRLVKEFINVSLAKLDNLEVARDVNEVKIVSAFDLGNKDKGAVIKILKEKIGRDLKVNEEIDSSLVAGFMIVLGSLVIDGSLRFKVGEKVKELTSKE